MIATKLNLNQNRLLILIQSNQIRSINQCNDMIFNRCQFHHPTHIDIWWDKISCSYYRKFEIDRFEIGKSLWWRAKKKKIKSNENFILSSLLKRERENIRSIFSFFQSDYRRKNEDKMQKKKLKVYRIFFCGSNTILIRWWIDCVNEWRQIVSFIHSFRSLIGLTSKASLSSSFGFISLCLYS